ncbi:Oidioi.mRNA.OKI2018_I69.XSR.g13645.t1.cds [Oikopleura dioica]|uniref:Oidioi.mRNA.OKI2018_I69.XSR.g13645.t1.cds n=1 Tax=Oikopleura dioica TaxID=34765 RepID=A0ABN7SB73_OIKDI|nr:Oidioi.mRNA.OKI2018_I69.XSR.g13645.t1.cds [Oikopleura dioica]
MKLLSGFFACTFGLKGTVQIKTLENQESSYSCVGNDAECSKFTGQKASNSTFKDCACYGDDKFCEDVCARMSIEETETMNPKIVLNKSEMHEEVTDADSTAYYSSYYYANCGTDSGYSVDQSRFEDKCDLCANMCYSAYSKVQCVRDCMRETSFCSNNSKSTLIARYADVGARTYGGHLYESRYDGIICAGYCAGPKP